MIPNIHAAAGVIGFLCILTFWTSIGRYGTGESNPVVAAVAERFVLRSAAAAQGQRRRTPDGATEYRGAQITVLFNRLVCSASEKCANNLPEVFRKGEKPWIVPDRADAQRIIEVVRQCPSGALRYAVAGRIGSQLQRAPAIRIARNGPYEIEGGVGLSAVAWCEGASQDRFALCRCGQSKNKPFCDGSHHAAGFRG